MRVAINGEELTIESPCSVHQLLERYKLDGGVCAVEVNKMLVPKRCHAEHALADGDHVEIVTLVGGG